MNLAIMGYGVVGSGVAELLSRNSHGITARSTQPAMRLKYILDIKQFPGDPFEELIIHDFNLILNDPSVGIVAEAMGGLQPAYDYVMACLRAGKSVVSSNKELVAARGHELMQVARECNVNFLFEASVGGGIPVIRPLSQCLAGNEICEVAGILNGTTNFILTRMIEDGMAFHEALTLAQNHGYAEADPTADIEGHDACRKICILATLAYGRHVYPEQVRTEGITALTPADIDYAGAFGCNIKLLARAQKRNSDGRISVVVAPMLVPRKSMLASVSDVYNAILIRGDAVEDVLFYGRGAGKFPTASAVVADIIDCAKHTERRRFFDWETNDPAFVAPAEDETARFYVRAAVDNPAQAKAAIDAAFPGAQYLVLAGADERELAFVTAHVRDGEARKLLAGLPGVTANIALHVAEFEEC